MAVPRITEFDFKGHADTKAGIIREGARGIISAGDTIAEGIREKNDPDRQLKELKLEEFKKELEASGKFDEFLVDKITDYELEKWVDSGEAAKVPAQVSSKMKKVKDPVSGKMVDTPEDAGAPRFRGAKDKIVAKRAEIKEKVQQNYGSAFKNMSNDKKHLFLAKLAYNANARSKQRILELKEGRETKAGSNADNMDLLVYGDQPLDTIDKHNGIANTKHYVTEGKKKIQQLIAENDALPEDQRKELDTEKVMQQLLSTAALSESTKEAQDELTNFAEKAFQKRAQIRQQEDTSKRTDIMGQQEERLGGESKKGKDPLSLAVKALEASNKHNDSLLATAEKNKEAGTVSRIKRTKQGNDLSLALLNLGVATAKDGGLYSIGEAKNVGKEWRDVDTLEEFMAFKKKNKGILDALRASGGKFDAFDETEKALKKATILEAQMKPADMPLKDGSNMSFVISKKALDRDRFDVPFMPDFLSDMISYWDDDDPGSIQIEATFPKTVTDPDVLEEAIDNIKMALNDPDMRAELVGDEMDVKLDSSDPDALVKSARIKIEGTDNYLTLEDLEKRLKTLKSGANRNVNVQPTTPDSTSSDATSVDSTSTDSSAVQTTEKRIIDLKGMTAEEKKAVKDDPKNKGAYLRLSNGTVKGPL